MTYKFISKDRTYGEWSVCNSDTFERIEDVEFNPLRDKLFNQDIFDLEQDGTAKVHNSVIRSSQYISAVLMISKKKTFGLTIFNALQKYTRVNESSSSKALFFSLI
mgnify:CR=1 FL=1